MTNLTQVAYITRQSIKFGAVGLVIFFILQFSFGIAANYYKKANPPAPAKPTVAFRKLPKIVFPSNEKIPNIVYKLETVTGGFPKLDSIGKVYVAVKPGATLLSLDNATALALKAGFIKPPQAVSDNLYRFTSQTTPATNFDINIITQNFRMYYEYANDSSILSEKKLPSSDEALTEAKTFLKSLNLLQPDLDPGNYQISYFRYSIPNLLPAISFSEADFVKLTLLRNDLDEMKILPNSVTDGPITFLFSGIREKNRRILEINYNYNKIDTERFATYPLKPVSTAWDELNANKGYISGLGENADGNVTIRDVSLAYYDSTEPQNYLQPIYVFEGDRNFKAYVPAVAVEWTD